MGFKRILLLGCQVILIGFAAFITIKYYKAVEPTYAPWMGAFALSNIFKLILGPILALFFLLSSYALGRLLWTRLGGLPEFPSPGTGFLLLSAIGIASQSIITWLFLSLGWAPSALIFFICLVVLVMEIIPTIEALRSSLSPPVIEGESASRKSLSLLIWPMLFCMMVTPFMWGTPLPNPYFDDPGASFKLTIGHSPLGLDIPLYVIYARIGGPWAATAVNLGLIWLIIIGMLETSRRLFNSLPAGLLGAILFLCIPFQYSLITQPSGEIVLAFFLFASFSALIWYLFDGSLGALPLSGFLLGLALSVSAKGIIFAVVFLLYAIIGSIGTIRRRLLVGIGILISFVVLAILFGSLLMVQNRVLTGNFFHPILGRDKVELDVPPPPEPDPMDLRAKPSKAKPIPADDLEGVDFPTEYGTFWGIGYKMTMSTDGDLKKGPQGLGPFFMAFIPGILLIMLTRRHTRQAWTLILLLLIFYLFWVYAARIVSLRMLYAIYPFQALVTGYIIDRLYLLSKLNEKRPISYIFLIIFIPSALFIFLWTCPGFWFM